MYNFNMLKNKKQIMSLKIYLKKKRRRVWIGFDEEWCMFTWKKKKKKTGSVYIEDAQERVTLFLTLHNTVCNNMKNCESCFQNTNMIHNSKSKNK